MLISTGRNNSSSIIDELNFKRLLSLERRRCERTGSPFALMIIEFDGLKRELQPSSVQAIAAAVAASMRETDVSGWYRSNSTLGVILTTLNGADRQTLAGTVVLRTRNILGQHLSAAQLQLIQISCQMFPEEVGDNDTNRLFYSEGEEKRTGTLRRAVIKRAIDIAGSLSALLLLSPLFAVIAIAIRLSSDGPILFRQKRMGRLGVQFTFLKFRSMYINNDPTIHKEYVRSLIEKKVDQQAGAFKIKNDPRVTPIGRLIRKTSLDELPQFINVLRGDMSLVGPRPPIPYEFESYSLWHRRRILEAKPGITGDWQVNGRSRTSFDEMVRMDLRYIQHQSVWTDLKILLKTPLAVISGDGAY